MSEISNDIDGRELEPLSLTTDPVRVLRFGAVTHNAHRIHYDDAYPRTEGLSGPVVMAQLQGALFHRAAATFAGPTGRVMSLSWQNRAPAYVGATLVVTGMVTESTHGTAILTMNEHSDDGALCATGRAIVSIH
ncbi:MaoC/PaaZ C-terminal domain-containing protein [Rhodococcoides yunnanense]|uniref:MaoC/PaaZ C-terminal domain-containing protein n=1 Tax=Rhodococcoides yunnanense TaxID=278209 RepID=UPI00093263BE|nr:MaoC/PaaZ C-terminal domain-containing protein [Rhodococcus yunnanensis]